MDLQPKRPPGRVDRKAATYAAEIVRLRAEGYTYDAIREALADVGIEVSESALRREMKRQQRPRPPGTAREQRPPSASAQSSPGATPAKSSTAVPPQGAATGREIAEAFFDAHPAQPLLRNRETS